MNTVTPEQKTHITKSLAVIGFVGVIILLAMLSVFVIRLIPSAFSSLASLAEGVQTYRDSLSDSNNGNIVFTNTSTTTTSGSAITIDWKKDSRPGTYAFSYACADSVEIELVDTEGLRTIACDTRYNIGDTASTTFIISTTDTKPQTVSYTVSFMRTNDTGPIRVGTGEVALSGTGLVAGVEDTKEELEIVTPIIKPVVVVAETPKKVVESSVPTYTYAIPVSDANGRTDLQATFLKTGIIKNNSFTETTMQRDATGAVQFEIKNIGTKTSGNWTYAVLLPDGESYVSPVQAALKPNERAVIALGFATPSIQAHTFSVVVSSATDRTLSNNTDSTRVVFVK